MSFSANHQGPSSDINVTPLIDVLLVLLIIFMVIVPTAQPGLKATAPQPSHTDQPAPEHEPVVLEVRAGAQGEPAYAINRQAVSRAELLPRLKAIFSARQDRTLFLKGDPALDFRTMADAVGVAKQASVETVGMLTPRDLAEQR